MEITPVVKAALDLAEIEKNRTSFSKPLQKARLELLESVHESFLNRPWETMEGAADTVCDYVQFYCDKYRWSFDGKNSDELLDTGLNFAGNLVGDYAEGSDVAI